VTLFSAISNKMAAAVSDKPLDLSLKSSDALANHNLEVGTITNSNDNTLDGNAKRKDQNRAAAQSYRKRQRDMGSDLEAEYTFLQDGNKTLTEECRRLEQSVVGMRAVLATVPPVRPRAAATVPPTAWKVHLQSLKLMSQLPTTSSSFLAEIKQEPEAPVAMPPLAQHAELRLRAGSSDAGYFSDTYSEASLDSSRLIRASDRQTKGVVVPFQHPAAVMPTPPVFKAKLKESGTPRCSSGLPLDPHDRKKEQNRRASKRFRERKKEERCLEEQELQDMEKSNARLKTTHGRLIEAIATLRNKLLGGDVTSKSE